MVSLAPSNLDADSLALMGRPFRKCYWSPGPRSTTRIDGSGRGFFVVPSIATNGNE